MAKRRNPKKEKADRNKINARKFRKASSNYSGKGRRYSNYNNESTESSENQSSETESNKFSASEDNFSKEKS